MNTCIDCGIDYYRKTFIGLERVVCCGEVKFLPGYMTEPLGRKKRCYRCNRLHREQYKREQYLRKQHNRKRSSATLRSTCMGNINRTNGA